MKAEVAVLAVALLGAAAFCEAAQIGVLYAQQFTTATCQTSYGAPMIGQSGQCLLTSAGYVAVECQSNTASSAWTARTYGSDSTCARAVNSSSGIGTACTYGQGVFPYFVVTCGPPDVWNIEGSSFALSDSQCAEPQLQVAGDNGGCIQLPAVGGSSASGSIAAICESRDQSSNWKFALFSDIQCSTMQSFVTGSGSTCTYVNGGSGPFAPPSYRVHINCFPRPNISQNPVPVGYLWAVYGLLIAVTLFVGLSSYVAGRGKAPAQPAAATTAATVTLAIGEPDHWQLVSVAISLMDVIADCIYLYYLSQLANVQTQLGMLPRGARVALFTSSAHFSRCIDSCECSACDGSFRLLLCCSVSHEHRCDSGDCARRTRH